MAFGTVARLLPPCGHAPPRPWGGALARKGGGMSLANILWLVVVVIVVLWLLGFVAHIAGGLIHLLLVLAVIVVIVNLIMGRRAV
jgi:hypothetical protein